MAGKAYLSVIRPFLTYWHASIAVGINTMNDAPGAVRC